MRITREMVEAQRALYVKRRQELWDNVNALSGAIDDCENWLQILGMEGERDGEEEGRGEIEQVISNQLISQTGNQEGPGSGPGSTIPATEEGG